MRDRLRRTVERHPLLWVALVATAGVLTGDGKIATGLLCGAALLALITYTGLRRFALVAMLVATMAGGLHTWRKSHQDADAARLERIRSAEITARLLSEPRTSLRGWSAVAEVREGGHPVHVWLQAEGRVPMCGELLTMKGRYEPLPLRRNPGTFDVFPWLYRQGICACFEALEIPRQIEGPSGFRQLENRARNAFRHAVTDGLDPEGRQAAVIRAMVLGDNPANDEELIGAYRNSGTLHAFSVSGMHVAMVGLIGWFVLKLLGVPRRAAVILILVGMLAYAWVTGMKPPAVRSVIMAAALLGAFLVRRRPDLLNALGFALLAAVLTNGHLIFQAGVQLSFGVVWAIGIGTAWASPAFKWIERREPYLPRQLYGPGREFWLRSREKTSAALAASTAASVGSIPLTLWHFGFLAPISILASPLIGLPILLLMALALLAVVCSPIAAVSQAVNRANGYVADSCTAMAAFFARIPGGNFSLPLDRPGEDFLIVYDPGYGGGASVLHERGQTVLIDTGSRAAFQRIVGPSMRRLAVVPDSIALSHPDGGHIGGAVDAALGPYPIRQVLIPVTRARSSVFRDLLKAADAKRIPATLGAIGVRYPVTEDSWLEVLHEPASDAMNTVADERVMVLLLHWRGWRILFMSDAGWNTERKLMDSDLDFTADVIVAGRHRHDSSLGEDFLAAVKPRAIIASHTDFPVEERIPKRWAEHCESMGIRLFHQGKTGAVTLALGKDGGLVLRGFLDGEELRLGK